MKLAGSLKLSLSKYETSPRICYIVIPEKKNYITRPLEHIQRAAADMGVTAREHCFSRASTRLQCY